MKKIISCLTAAAIFCGSLGLTAIAADPDTVDFLGGTAGEAPQEFGSIITKGGMGSATGTFLLESAVAGREDSDLSAVIASTAGLSKLKRIHAPLEVNDTPAEGEEYMLSFSVAARDKNSNKVVNFDASGEHKADPRNAYNIIDLSTDGKLYAFGTEMGEYNTDQWYKITVSFTSGSDKADIYLEEEEGKTVISDIEIGTAFTSFGTLYFGISGKNDTNNSAELCFDDIKLNTSDMKAGIVDFSSDDYSFNYSDMTVQINDKTTTYENVRNSIIANNGTTFVFLDSSENEITDESALVQNGTYVCFTSQDGSEVLKFKILKMSISIVEPANSCFIRPSDAFKVKAEAEADLIESVTLYMESDTETLSKELTQEPYEWEFNLTESGFYKVYAVLKDGTGNEMVSSEDIVVTVKENSAPTVKFTNLTDGESAYSGVIQDTISLSDADGTVEYIEIYLNDELYKREDIGKSSEVYALEIPDVPEGNVSIKVVAYDNEGASAETVVNMQLVFQRNVEIFNNTLEDNCSGIGWSEKGYENVSYEEAPGGGTAFTLTINAGSKEDSYFYIRDQLASAETQTIMLEYDLWIDDNARIQGAILDANRKYYAQYTINQNGTINNSVPLSGLKDAQGWLHIKHVMNTVNKDITITVNGHSIDQAAVYDSTPKLGEYRISFHNNSKTEECKLYMKNVKISRIEENTKVESVIAYKDGVATDITDIAEVDPKLTALEFTMSNNVKYTDILRNNIKLYENGHQLGLYNVAMGTLEEQSISDESQRTKNKVTVTFDRPLRSNSEYKLVFKKGIKLDNELTVLADIIYSFKTAPADFDVLDWQLDNSGGTITVKANVQNGTDAPVLGKMVVAVYSDMMLVGSSIIPFNAVVGASVLTSNAMTVNGENLQVYGALWDDNNIELTKQFEYNQ